MFPLLPQRVRKYLPEVASRCLPEASIDQLTSYRMRFQTRDLQEDPLLLLVPLRWRTLFQFGRHQPLLEDREKIVTYVYTSV